MNLLTLAEPTTSKFNARFVLTDSGGVQRDPKQNLVFPNVVAVDDYLWIAETESIPYAYITGIELKEKNTRHFAHLKWRNAYTGEMYERFFAARDALGAYLKKPLVEFSDFLEERIENADFHALCERFDLQDHEDLPQRTPPHRGLRCEACDSDGTFVEYAAMFSILVYSSISPRKPRIHCAAHNRIHGIPYYLLTICTGWLGPGIVDFPFVSARATKAIQKSVSKPTFWFLNALPALLLLGLLVGFLLN